MSAAGSDGTVDDRAGRHGQRGARLGQRLGRAGGRIVVGEPVASISLDGGAVRGVVLGDGTELRARAVMVNADPFTLQRLVGSDQLPDSYNARLSQMKRPGSTFKLNLALEKAPSFRCLPEPRAQFGPTIHLLPEEGSVLAQLERGWQAVQRGELADFPSIEWYMHSTVDRSLSDAQGDQLGVLRAVGALSARQRLLGAGSRALRTPSTGDRRSLRSGHE